jgi:hypothetical protein
MPLHDDPQLEELYERRREAMIRMVEANETERDAGRGVVQNVPPSGEMTNVTSPEQWQALDDLAEARQKAEAEFQQIDAEYQAVRGDS